MLSHASYEVMYLEMWLRLRLRERNRVPLPEKIMNMILRRETNLAAHTTAEQKEIKRKKAHDYYRRKVDSMTPEQRADYLKKNRERANRNYHRRKALKT